MKNVREEDLIAYHLGELSLVERVQMKRRLEKDAKLAAQSEEVAETLRAFCCEPTPVVSEAAFERSWQRVRGSLGVLEQPKRTWKVWALGAATGAAAAVAVMAIVLVHGAASKPVATASVTSVGSPKGWSERLLAELHTRKPAELVNHRPGPLTTGPVDVVAEDPALAAHLDSAERVLTEVSHADGPLQEGTRDQVHRLLLANAVYHLSAEKHGDMATAAVIDDLGRVLTSLDAEPVNAGSKERSPDAFRMQVNVGGVLLDLRILHHNNSPREQ